MIKLQQDYRKWLVRITITLLLSSQFIILPGSATQANLIENNTQFKIFSGNFFTIIINKNEGPIINFEVDNNRIIQLRYEYLSEYQSTGLFMTSEENLCGKSYALNQINWNKKAASSTSKAFVNLTREGLSDNASIAVSTIVFNQKQIINNQSVSALSEAYIGMSINNWSYTEGVKGLALNLQVYETESQKYEILGPYFNFSTQKYNLKVIDQVGGVSLFVFKPTISIINKQGEKEEISFLPFANYPVASYIQQPANFWLSFPSIEEIQKIIFEVIFKIIKKPTKSTGINESGFYILAVMIFVIIHYSSFYLKKRKKD